MFHISTPDNTWCEYDKVIVTLCLIKHSDMKAYGKMELNLYPALTSAHVRSVIGTKWRWVYGFTSRPF